MKVFISWSGETSFEVAKILKEWIPCVIQDVQPYFSSEDIDKGARWSTDIAKELEAASFGILCVTKDNLESQWLNFEAGALSKAIDKSKVCPLLFRLKPSDISNSPILQFQMTNVEEKDIYKLFKSINASLGDEGLDETRLEKVFNTFWPQMDAAFKAIDDSKSKSESQVVKKSESTEILEEMLELLRSQQMILRRPERILPVEYIQEVLNHSQNENNKMSRNPIPVRAIRDLERSEMELWQAISNMSEIEEESLLKIKACAQNYTIAVQRILKYLGINFHSFEIYRGEE